MNTSTPPPTPTSDLPRLPPRPATMHKGQAGHVAVIAGSRGMSGAAILAALGALRSGAGLVRVLTPASVQPIVAAAEPGLMTVALPETDAGGIDGQRALPLLDLDWAHVIALGPGLGQSDELRKFVRDILKVARVPVVVDADGLNNLAAMTEADPWWTQRHSAPTIITPHPGEMERLRNAADLPSLTDQDGPSRLACAHQYAVASGAIVVLKGHRTVVSTAQQTYVNTTGNPGMATGGMGDVLTGVIAALLGQGLAPFDAARLGVHAHGLAADYCAKEIAPFGYLAREVADALPAALQDSTRQRVGFA